MKIFQVDDRGRINLQQVKDLPVENCKFLSSRSAVHHQSNTRKRNVELHIWKAQSEEELMHPPGATMMTKEEL